jgi:predicted O-methyltransferase YrrM
MTPETWTAIDRYLAEHCATSDAALEAALADSAAAGLPPIQVTPNLGKLLHLFARLIGARRILEIGTLGGYSTIWLARALPPDGRLITLEIDPLHARIARTNLDRAGLGGQVELRLGPALETLAALVKEGVAPFDLIFIDADKERTADYFDWGVRLARPGGAIVVDNVVRQGAVIAPQATEPSLRGIQRFFQQVPQDRRVSVTAIQTVGAKGYDGFALALVVPPEGTP